jgi:aminobenzoyl-glutamate utilization protein B
MNQQKKQLLDAIDKKAQIFCDLGDQIWGFAETRFALKRSADALCKCLEQEGFTIRRGVSGMSDAFIASYGQSGPVIGILGEYDALPTMSQVAGSLEKKPLEEGAAGHGCGHHLLGAGSLAAAVGLKDYLAQSGEKAVVRFYGCPAEESGSGKAYLARGGEFAGVDAFLTWHPMTETQVVSVSSLANYQIWFRFKGTSAHAAATPHLGRSALDACELMNVGVNYLREHIIPEARVHYAYTDAGGGAPNVVQSSASLLYFIRTPKSSQLREIFDRIADIAKGAALMTGTSMEIEWDSAVHEYIVNDTLNEAAHQNMTLLGPIQFSGEEFECAANYTSRLDDVSKRMQRASIARAFKDESDERITEIAGKTLLDVVFPFSRSDAVLPGSTDVSDASWLSPTGQIAVSCFPAGTTPHSWQWVALGKSSMAHKGLLYAGKILAMTALDIIQTPELLVKAKSEWQKRLSGETYKCEIPPEVMPK